VSVRGSSFPSPASIDEMQPGAPEALLVLLLGGLLDLGHGEPAPVLPSQCFEYHERVLAGFWSGAGPGGLFLMSGHGGDIIPFEDI